MRPLRIALTKGRLEKDTVGLFEADGDGLQRPASTKDAS